MGQKDAELWKYLLLMCCLQLSQKTSKLKGITNTLIHSIGRQKVEKKFNINSVDWAWDRVGMKFVKRVFYLL